MSEAFNIVRGDSFSIQVTVTDDAGDPVDLTGATVVFTAKKNIHDNDNDASLNQVITNIPNPTGGVCQIAFEAQDTADLQVGTHFWDIQYTIDGVVTSTGRKTLRVIDDITRNI